MLTYERYLMPASIDEALEIAAAHQDSHRLLSGGTDLIPYSHEARSGDLQGTVLIDLSRIANLRQVNVVGDRIEIGAGVTFSDFLESRLLREWAPLLGQCALQIADEQIRYMATIGGNIMHASPAADGTVALIALNAEVVLDSLWRGRRVRREVPLVDFITGPNSTQRMDGEILTSVRCDAMGPEFGSAFYKIGRRRSLIIAVASAAAVVRLSPDGASFADVRLSVGAVSAVPARLRECEQAVVGQPVSRAIISEAAELARNMVSSRSRQAYRRDVVVAFVEEALIDAVSAIGGRVQVQHG